MRFSDLAGLLDGVAEVACQDGGDPALRRACFDSRRVQAGDLYCALPGHRSDGRAFLADAFRNGAAAVLLHGDTSGYGALPALRVRDSSRVAAAAGLAAHHLAGTPSEALWSAAVTGTNGKSTVVHLVERALNAAGVECAGGGTLGLRCGDQEQAVANTTPSADLLHDWLARSRAHGAQAAVLEASSHGIVQDRLAGIRFDAAAWTNLSHDHLDYHDSLDAYAAAKGLLFRRLPTSAIGLLPAAQPELREHCTGSGAQLLAWGLDAPLADLRGEVELLPEGLRLDVSGVFGAASIHSRLIGRHNADNLLVAFGLLRAAGIEADAAAAALADVGAAPGRLQRVAPQSPWHLYVDYAHTPEALRHVLAALREAHPAARLGAVFGAGGDRDAVKRAPMGAAVAEGADWCVVTSDNPRGEAPDAIAAQVLDGVERAGGRAEVELDRRAAIRLAVERLRPGDVLLVAGKGHETYQETAGERRHFDDCEELQEAAACSA